MALSAIVALWLGFAAPVAAGYDEGAAAFIRGDYEEAWREWRDLGERGHQSAQYNLGVLYSIGLGVEQDEAEASKWFRRAADRGLPAAQMRLGSAYMEGKGVTEDLKEAYFWFTLAATHFSLGEQHEQAVAARETTGAGLTRAQITEVLERAMSWKPLPQAVDESEKERLIAEPTGESSLASDGGSSNGLGSGAPDPSGTQSKAAEFEAGGAAEVSEGYKTQIADAGTPGAQAAEPAEAPSEPPEIGDQETDSAQAGTLETSAAGSSAAETGVEEPAQSESATSQVAAAEAHETQKAAAMAGEQPAESAAEEVKEEAEEDVAVELATATSGSEAQETSDSPDRPAGPWFAAHLSSVRTKDGAEAEWRNLQGQHPALLDARDLTVTSIEVAEQGTFYRVMAGLFETFDEAQALCSQLQQSQQYCEVRHLSALPSQD